MELRRWRNLRRWVGSSRDSWLFVFVWMWAVGLRQMNCLRYVDYSSFSWGFTDLVWFLAWIPEKALFITRTCPSTTIQDRKECFIKYSCLFISSLSRSIYVSTNLYNLHILTCALFFFLPSFFQLVLWTFFYVWFFYIRFSTSPSAFFLFLLWRRDIFLFIHYLRFFFPTHSNVTPLNFLSSTLRILQWRLWMFLLIFPLFLYICNSCLLLLPLRLYDEERFY